MLNPCWGKLVQEGMFLSDEVMDMIFYCDKIPKSDRCKIIILHIVCVWGCGGEMERKMTGENRLCWTLALLDTFGSGLLYS